MGCDIHIITEIRKDGKWKHIDEVPNSYTDRNYSLFSVLADVRNSFMIKGFKPRGLPDDLSEKRFYFNSVSAWIKEKYETDTEKKYVMGDGVYRDHCDPTFLVDSNENGKNSYNPIQCGATIEAVPVKELYSFDEFTKKFYDLWDEEMNDFGLWGVDFDCPDYHSFSWLTLEDLMGYDTEDYHSERYRIPKEFYDRFIQLGGVLPYGMQAKEIEEDEILKILGLPSKEIIIYCPETAPAPAAFEKGIEELKEIAKKYDVGPKDIRIVFAFDN